MSQTSRPANRPNEPDQPLAGMHVLVAEDEAIIAMELEAVLLDSGAMMVGPAYTLDAALECAGQETITAAILDLRLGRNPITPVARKLAARSVPFLFYTGQSPNDPIRSEWPRHLLIGKPADSDEIVRILLSITK